MGFGRTAGSDASLRAGRLVAGRRIRRWPVPTSACAAQGFTLFGHGCFFAFERLARLLVPPAFRVQARRRAHRHSPLRSARAVRRVRRGAAHRRRGRRQSGHETLIQLPRPVRPRGAGARTDSARLTPPCSSPPAVALSRSSRAFAYERRTMAANGPRSPPFGPLCEAGARMDDALLSRGAHRHLPFELRPRVVAFADERRIAGGAEGGRVRTRNTHAVPPGSAAPPTATPTTRGARRSIRFTSVALERMTRLFTPACSSPPSVAMRPRVAARSPMRGASWRGTQAAECRCARLVRSHRTLRVRRLP